MSPPKVQQTFLPPGKVIIFLDPYGVDLWRHMLRSGCLLDSFTVL